MQRRRFAGLGRGTARVLSMLGDVGGTGTTRVMAILSRIRDEGWLKPGELVPIVLGNSNSALVSNVLRIENVPAD